MVQFQILSIPGWLCKASDKTHSDPPSCKPHFNARKTGIPIIDSMDATHKPISSHVLQNPAFLGGPMYLD